MNKSFAKSLLLVGLLLSTCLLKLSAQKTDQELSTIIPQHDSLFWKAYNTCDTTSARRFLSDDIEFYHDKGGPSFGLTSLMETFRNNLCSSTSLFRLRREAVAGSLKVFPLRESDVIYGAILTGEHEFYIREDGKAERLDGRAKFTHLWLLKNTVWKMTRVLSYDHGPATRKK